MPYYQHIRYLDQKEKQRTIEGLLRLKEALREQVPVKTTASNLLIATWNIREFDSKVYGPRMSEAIYYIAEIIDHFDLIAVQEVNENLNGLERLLDVLGYHWKYIYTDVTEGSSGNNERLGFLYDTRKLTFTGLAGEIVIPPEQLEEDGHNVELNPQRQLVRTPFVISLRTSWFRFMITTVHIIYGSGSQDDPRRVREIRLLSDFLAKRADDPNAVASNLILLGDFNIFQPKNQTYQEITRNFHIPEALQNLPSNVSQNRFYDQMAFRGQVPTEHIQAGIFNFFEYVYRMQDEQAYAKNMPEKYAEKEDAEDKSRYFRVWWRTHQMSDHLPMWTELKIDQSEAYLKSLQED